MLSTRARQARGAPVGRPSFRIGNTITCEPADGVVEGVVIVHGKARTRAVAIRLEGLDKRWRASAINVLWRVVPFRPCPQWARPLSIR